MGGKDGSRGYLYQSIISVLSSCMSSNWNYISVEYKTESDKVDIAFLNDQIISKAIQVKSSINLFEKAKIKKWMQEIKEDVIAEEYEITLIGNCGEDANEFIKAIENYNKNEIVGKTKDYISDIEDIIKDKNFKIRIIPFEEDNLMSIVRDNINRWIFSKGYAVDPIALDQLTHALITLITFWGTDGKEVEKDYYENKIFEWLKNSAGNKLKKIVSISELKISSYDEEKKVFIEPRVLKVKSLQSYQHLKSDLIQEGKILIDKINNIDLEPYDEVVMKNENDCTELKTNSEKKELVKSRKLPVIIYAQPKDALVELYTKAELCDEEKEKMISQIKEYWDIDISTNFFYVGQLKKSSILTRLTGKISYDGEDIEQRKYKLIELLEIFIYKLNCIDIFMDAYKSVYILPLCIRNVGATVDNNISVSISVKNEKYHLLDFKKDLGKGKLETLRSISDYFVEENVINEIFTARENKDIFIEKGNRIQIPPVNIPFDSLGRRHSHDLESLMCNLEDFQVEENQCGYTNYDISNLRPGEAKWLSPFPLLIVNDVEKMYIEYSILSEASENKLIGKLSVSE